MLGPFRISSAKHQGKQSISLGGLESQAKKQLNQLTSRPDCIS